MTCLEVYRVRQVWPHELFRADFDQLPEEAKRQEQMLPVNRGEYKLACEMYDYLSKEVLPLIIHDDWVFEAAATFASEYAADCLRYLRLGGEEVYRTQQRLVGVKEKVVDFVARVAQAHPSMLPPELAMAKPSDFIGLVDVDRLQRDLRTEAKELYELCKDHEMMQLTVVLRSIRDNYETTLPRVMYVIRRAIKVALGLPPRSSDEELTSISEYMDWYECRLDSTHALHTVFGKLRDFYVVARNCGSHHKGLEWDPDNNDVILRDTQTEMSVHIDEFMQRYRYLVVYLCDYGLRGILAAFAERERGSLSNMLVREYTKTFPEDFPEGEPARVRFY